MIHHHEYKTIGEAIATLSISFLSGEIEPDGTDGNKFWSNNHLVVIQDPYVDQNIVEVGFTFRRWQKFINEYIEPTELAGFFEKAKKLSAGQEISYVCPVKADHSLGNCLIGVTAHVVPTSLTFFSRASNLVPTGALDLGFAAALSNNFARVTKFKNVPFIWHVSQLQFHTWSTIPYLVFHDFDFTKYDTPVAKVILKHWTEIQAGKAPTTYKQIGRIAERALAYQAHKPTNTYFPELPINFTKSYVHSDILTVEKLIARFGVTRRDIRYILRPFRDILDSVGIRSFRGYDLVWPADHPEVRVIEWSAKTEKKVTSLTTALEVLQLKDLQALRAVYDELGEEI